MAGYSPISDILSFGKSKKYSDKIMSNIINIDLKIKYWINFLLNFLREKIFMVI